MNAESSKQSGFALPSILWFLIVLSLMAASVSLVAHSENKLALALMKNAKQNAAIQAGLNIALARLSHENPNLRWSVHESPYQIQVGGWVVEIRISDELGKVDINSADDSLLVALFEATGRDASEASALKDRIRDWRDENDLVHLNGAESIDYQREGFPFDVRNAPFETASEFAQVMGVDEVLFDCVIQELTVHSGRASVDPFSSGPLARRASGKVLDKKQTTRSLHSATVGTAANKSVAGRTLNIVSRTGQVSRKIVVRFTEHREEPYWVLSAGNKPSKVIACGPTAIRSSRIVDQPWR